MIFTTTLFEVTVFKYFVLLFFKKKYWTQWLKVFCAHFNGFFVILLLIEYLTDGHLIYYSDSYHSSLVLCNRKISRKTSSCLQQKNGLFTILLEIACLINWFLLTFWWHLLSISVRLSSIFRTVLHKRLTSNEKLFFRFSAKPYNK